MLYPFALFLAVPTITAAALMPGFGLKALKKHQELVPLVTILGTAVVGACGFMAHAVITKPDVRVVKSRGPAENDVSPQELRKIFRIKQEIPMPPPEIIQLRKEIGSYKS